MARQRWIGLVALVVSMTACYHQVVNTGQPAGNTEIDVPWAQGWFWGLVAPKPIETRTQCPSGVATVMTETSFANGLVSVLTLGIYTPVHVRITCARSGTSSLPRGAPELVIPASANAEERAAIVTRAIELSAESRAPVVLRF